MYENERRDYETHIPEQLTDFAEVKALSTEVNVQIKDVYGAMEVLLKNVITNTMDEKVVARWEKYSVLHHHLKQRLRRAEMPY